MFNDQLTFLGACFADEIMSGTGIKQNGNGVSIQGKRTSKYLLTLRNVLHSSVVDVTDLCNDHLLQTMWRMSGVAFFFGAVYYRVKWHERP
jgi:hypothetical protein